MSTYRLIKKDSDEAQKAASRARDFSDQKRNHEANLAYTGPKDLPATIRRFYEENGPMAPDGMRMKDYMLEKPDCLTNPNYTKGDFRSEHFPRLRDTLLAKRELQNLEVDELAAAQVKRNLYLSDAVMASAACVAARKCEGTHKRDVDCPKLARHAHEEAFKNALQEMEASGAYTTACNSMTESMYFVHNQMQLVERQSPAKAAAERVFAPREAELEMA